jgi:hypothetical protein
MRNRRLRSAQRRAGRGPWGRYVHDQTWEYMYALDEIRPLNVPYAEFNAAIDYEPDTPPYGFRVLSEEKNLALLRHLPLASERHVPPTSEKQYEDAAAALTGDLDRKVEAIQRAEQAYLRRMLLPGQDALCDLCGRRFEIELLVAAHIKKRAACSDSDARSDPRSQFGLQCVHACPRAQVDVLSGPSMRRHPSRGTRAGTGHTVPDWMRVQRASHQPVRHEDWHRASGGC